MSRVFAYGSGDRGSIPKTQKMVLDTSLLNTQHYKLWNKSKVIERTCQKDLSIGRNGERDRQTDRQTELKEFVPSTSFS